MKPKATESDDIKMTKRGEQESGTKAAPKNVAEKATHAAAEAGETAAETGDKVAAEAAATGAQANAAKTAAELGAKVTKPFYRRPAVIGTAVGVVLIPAATYVLYELLKPEAEPEYDN